MAAQDSDLEDQQDGSDQGVPSVKVASSQQAAQVLDSQEAVQLASSLPPAFVTESQSAHVQGEPVDESGANPELPQSAPNEDLPSFDWEDFETRYELAMATARSKEASLLYEFDSQVKVKHHFILTATGLMCCSILVFGQSQLHKLTAIAHLSGENTGGIDERVD